jgi:type I restriction enzyme, R subunit
MTFNAAESYQSQVPAIQTLVALGYAPISQQDAEAKRGRLSEKVHEARACR